jgi:hypothetical protein
MVVYIYSYYLTAAEKSARSWAAPVRVTGTEREKVGGRARGPVHHVQNETCRVTLQQARRAAV